MARITERNGKYKVVIELGKDNSGKRIRHTKEGFKTKKEAKAYATIKENEMLNGMIPTSNKILLKDFINSWYQNYICNNNLSPNTISSYRYRIFFHIIPRFGNIPIDKIQTLDVQNFYYDLLKQDIKPSSCKKIISSLKVCLNYAIKMKLINHNPCDIQYIKNRKDKLNIWTEEQLIYFINEIKGEFLYLPVVLAAFTGMRIGELCGLRYCNIDFKKSRIKICEQVVNDRINKTLIHTNILKTSKSNRIITIPDFLKDIILNNKYSDDFVLLDNLGNMCNPVNLTMIFTRRLRKCNLPRISFHDLRHTHATILLLHGENVKVISERLGHESVNMTLNTYSHVFPNMEEHTSLLLNSIFKEKI